MTTDQPVGTVHNGPAGSGPRRFGVLTLVAVIVLLGGLAFWYFSSSHTSPRLALVTSGEGPYWDLVIAGANEAARQNDVDLTVVRSKSDAEFQKQAVRGLLGKHMDGIAISPLSAGGDTSILAEIAANTTLVTVDNDSSVARRLCFVGTDNYAAGRLCGELVHEAIPDGGEVILCIGFPDKENSQRRRQGVIDELLERNFDPARTMDPLDQPVKGDKYTIVATLVDNADRQAAVDLAVKAVKDHPDVKCFVGLLGYSTPALIKAMDQAGKTKQIKLVGFDVVDETLAGIEAETVYGTIMQDQFGLGFHAVRILANDARGIRGGLPLFQSLSTACKVVTKDNLAKTRAELDRLRSAKTAGQAVAAATPAS